MTSKEIQALNGFDRSEKDWLKEIAYQLAVMNEKQGRTMELETIVGTDFSYVLPTDIPKRGPGRPKKVA